MGESTYYAKRHAAFEIVRATEPPPLNSRCASSKASVLEVRSECPD
jgi:hypothetical protein